MHKTVLRGLLTVGLVVTSAGAQCSRPAPPPIPTKIQGKVEFFKSKQLNTTTPHGKIDMGTVQETPEGVAYSTTDAATGK